MASAQLFQPTRAAIRLQRAENDRIPVADTRKPVLAASRLPSYQSQTKTRTVTVRFPDLHGKVDSVSVVSACIILQGGGGRRHRSELSRPAQEASFNGIEE